jgi:hypothetical protein
MASVIHDARARREEAVRLRMEAVALRLATRQLVRAARGHMAATHAAGFRLRGALDAPQPSPWSELHWRYRDAELERVLVPVD